MKRLASRTAQYPLRAEFAVSYNEWAVDSVTGLKTTFGSTAAASTDPLEFALTAGTGITFDVIPMPVGAVITSGELIVETAFVGIGTGATLSVGIAGNLSALVSALDLDAAVAGSSVQFLLTAPMISNAGQNLRLTTAGLVATATAGKFRVRVNYTIDNRTSEIQIT